MEKIIDYISGIEINDTPEEREATQPFSKILVEDYNYPKHLIKTRPQYRVKANPSDKDSYPIDIAVFEDDNNGKKKLKIIVECKRKTRKDGEDQLKLYLKFSEAEIGVWYNGRESLYLHKIEQSGHITFEEIPSIPRYKEQLDEIGLYIRKNLKPTHNLKSIFQEIKGWIAGNGNLTKEDEVAKQIILLVLCKIYDERFTKKEEKCSFRSTLADSDETIKERILRLFKSVKSKYSDVINPNDDILFDGKTLKHVIGKIQNFCIIESERDIISDAFEVFMYNAVKGDQGQFFTPKNVVKVIVEAINIKRDDKIIDSACGSGGFLVEALNKLKQKIELEASEYGWNDEAKSEEFKTVAIKNIRGIDKEPFLAQVAKSYMAIMGDGKGGIFCEDSLDTPSNWCLKTRANIELETFDILLANPPFGKNIKVEGKTKLSQYALAHKTDTKGKTTLVEEGNVSSLFLERNLQFLKNGGKLGIILPETYFHAPKQHDALNLMFKGNNIMWVIDLPHNTFRPYNNAKCIAIIIQKGVSQQEYINMAVAEYIGHDHNGNVIYKEGTKELLDDTIQIIREIKERNSNNGDLINSYEKPHTFKVKASEVIKKKILVPRYYWKEKEEEIEKEAKLSDISLVSLDTLIKKGIIKCFDGNGSPESKFKGLGDIPYVRVKDIVNWQVYTDVTSLIPESEYNRLYKKEKQLYPKDILYVRRGSYRIGSVAMVSPYNTKCILTREILVIRMLQNNNEYNITPEYLLYALSHKLSWEQAENKIFMDTTLPNIAERWKEIKIPIFNKPQEMKKIKDYMEDIINKNWESTKGIHLLKEKFNVFNT